MSPLYNALYTVPNPPLPKTVRCLLGRPFRRISFLLGVLTLKGDNLFLFSGDLT